MSQDSPPATSVMVGYDGSSGARGALGWARRLATAVDARLTVVHAGSDMPPAGAVPPELEGKERSLEVTGPPAGALLETSRDLQVDLKVRVDSHCRVARSRRWRRGALGRRCGATMLDGYDGR